MSIVVRTDAEPRAVLKSLRHAVSGTNNSQVLYQVRTMEELASASLARQRFLLLLFGIFAGFALLLGCVGIYGVLKLFDQPTRARIRSANGAWSDSRSSCGGRVTAEPRHDTCRYCVRLRGRRRSRTASDFVGGRNATSRSMDLITYDFDVHACCFGCELSSGPSSKPHRSHASSTSRIKGSIALCRRRQRSLSVF
jgi:hypothetical protein